MRILLISDWHRGFSHNTFRIHEKAVREWPEFDVLICAGDMGSHKFAHFKAAYKFFRKVVGDKPILCVLGNHDYWNARQKVFLESLIEKQNKVFQEYKIHCLSRQGEFRKDDCVFVGVDGFYNYWGNSNDPYYFPISLSEASVETYMWNAELSQISYASKALSKTAGTRILVNHIPFHPALWSVGHFKPEYASNQRNWRPFEGLVDYYLYGHTHRGILFKHEGCTIANCGADYNKPEFLLIDTKTEEHLLSKEQLNNRMRGT